VPAVGHKRQAQGVGRDDGPHPCVRFTGRVSPSACGVVCDSGACCPWLRLLPWWRLAPGWCAGVLCTTAYTIGTRQLVGPVAGSVIGAIPPVHRLGLRGRCARGPIFALFFLLMWHAALLAAGLASERRLRAGPLSHLRACHGRGFAVACDLMWTQPAAPRASAHVRTANSPSWPGSGRAGAWMTFVAARFAPCKQVFAKAFHAINYYA